VNKKVRVLGILLIFTGAISHSPVYPTKQPETWVNVFTHGIMSIKPHLTVPNFIRFMCDDVHNCVYARTVELMRQDPIFYKNQAMQGLGLQPISPEVAKGNASGAMAMVFDTMSNFANKGAPITNYYYTFGWTGLMSPTQRYKDARNLYVELTQELKRLNAQGIYPKVRLIGYSHGGNVLLNLARVRQNNPDLPPLTVNELVLLGMPVQSETDYLINDPIFEIIYHIYSRGDRIQKLDFFSCHRFFSRRIFKPRTGFVLPEKLIQIQLACTRNVRWYQERHRKPACQYNFKYDAVVSGKSRFFRTASPGHSELWFFGWTPSHYRKHFPLSPLPAASLVPIIIREARNFTEKSWYEKPTLIDIRPEHEIMIVGNQKARNILYVSKFLSQEELAELKAKVWQYEPENFTLARYDGAIKSAFKQADREYRECRISKRRNRRERMKQRQQGQAQLT
jgi:hypothetical protein